MEYIHICPKCKQEVVYKQQWSFEEAEKENRLCLKCREQEKWDAMDLTRICSKCGKEIKYKRKGDYDAAVKANTVCKSCCENPYKFKKGINDSDHRIKINPAMQPKDSLDALLDETIESFYWLGFIIADGSFYKTNFEITLKEGDKDHLEKFKAFLSADSEIKYRSKTNSYRLSFSNRFSIPKVMDKYKINYNKTYNPCSFDNFKSYSKELLMSLFIGIVDGDGPITKDGKYITITSHTSWRDFYQNFIDYLNLPFFIRNHQNTTIISCGNKNGRKIFQEFLSTHQLPLLNRKWDRFVV